MRPRESSSSSGRVRSSAQARSGIQRKTVEDTKMFCAFGRRCAGSPAIAALCARSAEDDGSIRWRPALRRRVASGKKGGRLSRTLGSAVAGEGGSPATSQRETVRLGKEPIPFHKSAIRRSRAGQIIEIGHDRREQGRNQRVGGADVEHLFSRWNDPGQLHLDGLRERPARIGR